MSPEPELVVKPAPEGGRGRLGAAVRFALGLPARVLLFLLAIYQRVISPALPVLTLGTCGCRFAPTCSQYAVDAVRTHGALVGVWLALRRLVKCTPLHPGGIDPVPPRRARDCRRVAAPTKRPAIAGRNTPPPPEAPSGLRRPPLPSC